MITVAGLTPSIDRYIHLERLSVGGTNRPLLCQDRPGGKGFHVARMLKKLGCDVHLITPAYRTGMAPMLEMLERSGLGYTAVPAPGELRVNTKLLDRSASMITEINMPAVLGDSSVREACAAAIDSQAEKSDWLVLTGSLPHDVPAGFYAERIRHARCAAPKCRILLDTAGEALRLAIPEKPDMIKPNRHELELLTGRSLPTAQDIAHEALRLNRQGIRTVLVSMDADGSLLVTENRCLSACAIHVDVETTVGAGDSLVAGYLSASVENPQDCETALRTGIACASAHVAGCDDAYRSFLDRVEIRPVAYLP